MQRLYFYIVLKIGISYYFSFSFLIQDLRTHYDILGFSAV
jgi:hypothetical protein